MGWETWQTQVTSQDITLAGKRLNLVQESCKIDGKVQAVIQLTVYRPFLFTKYKTT